MVRLSNNYNDNNTSRLLARHTIAAITAEWVVVDLGTLSKYSR